MRRADLNPRPPDVPIPHSAPSPHRNNSAEPERLGSRPDLGRENHRRGVRARGRPRTEEAPEGPTKLPSPGGPSWSHVLRAFPPGPCASHGSPNPLESRTHRGNRIWAGTRQQARRDNPPRPRGLHSRSHRRSAKPNTRKSPGQDPSLSTRLPRAPASEEPGPSITSVSRSRVVAHVSAKPSKLPHGLRRMAGPHADAPPRS